MILSTLLAIPFCCTAMPAAAEPSPARQKELIHWCARIAAPATA
jgi:hypothetical protein